MTKLLPMIFGLDIGSFSCKVIQCQKRGDKFVLQKWGEIKTPVSPDAPDAKSQTIMAETIKKLVADAKIEGGQVVTALPEKQVYSRIIQLPLLSDAELSSAIEYEAEQYIPLPLEKVQLEYTVLSHPAKTEQGAKMDILLIAAQKEAVDQLVHLLDMSGLVPQALETEILALERALNIYPDTSLIINIGNESSNLIISEGQKLKFIYTFPVGGETLTRALSQTLALDPVQAEEYKKAYGLDMSVLEGKVASALASPFGQIVEQIQKTMNFYLQKNPAAAIKRLILVGGTAQMPGLTSFLTQKLGLETVIGDPFAQFIQDKNFPPELAGKGTRFVTAVGLAMRGI